MNQSKVKYSLSNWDLVTVNPNYKTWNWKDLFYFWGTNIQSVIGFSLISSLYIVYNLNTFIVFFGTILGSFFVYIFCMDNNDSLLKQIAIIPELIENNFEILVNTSKETIKNNFFENVD